MKSPGSAVARGGWLALLVATCACAGGHPVRHTRAEVAASLRSLPDAGTPLTSRSALSGTPANPPGPAVNAEGSTSGDGLVVGEFQIAGTASVVDGDTIRVKGLDATLRLLGIDTEETFKHEPERSAYRAGWASYKKAMRGESPRPVKMATPLGEDAKHFAEAFFRDVSQVRLERDHPKEIRDFYGRYLAYVFALKQGVWVNYNLECVRVGMSPYFQKYGRSRRFHGQFLEAQRDARERKIGIWDPAKEHYDDYDERLVWWNARSEAVARFEARAAQRDDHLPLTRFDALERLAAKLGQQVSLLGSVGEVHATEHGPTLVKLSHDRRHTVDLVFFDPRVLEATGLSQGKGELVEARGKLEKYVEPHRGYERLQIVIHRPEQVTLAAPAPPAMKMVSPPIAPAAPRAGPPAAADEGTDAEQPE